MSLTPAEQRELEQLQRDEEQRRVAGMTETVDAHLRTVTDGASDKDGFSIMRTVLGSVRDPINEVLEFGRDAIQAGQRIGRRLGGEAETLDLGTGDILPDLPGSERAGTAENIVRDIGGYLVPYTGWAKAFRVMKGATWVGRMGRGVAAGAMTDFTAQDPMSANLANTMRDAFGIESDMLDALANEEDDDRLVSRVKAAATNIPLGIAAESAFELGAKVVRAYRSARGNAEEAAETYQALRGDYAVKVEQKTVKEAVEDVLDEPQVTKEPFDPERHVDATNQPESWEDVLSYLQRRAGGDLDVDQQLLDDMAEIVHGDPDNALARMGIDPAKLDWSEYANPDGAARLQKALSGVYENIAERLGRSNKRVSNASVAAAARAFASDANVLKALYGATSKLPELLTAARMFVGGHAHVLLKDAEDALDRLMGDGEGGAEAWAKFLESFHRHAFYLGSVRGAGSEIGRALQSLKMLARRNAEKNIIRDADKLKSKVDDAARDADKATETADDQLNAVLSIESDGERIALLSTLLDKKGDIGELAQFVRQKNGSSLQRLSDSTKETLGSLFSQATAAFNIASGLGFMGMRAVSRWLSTTAWMGLAPFSKSADRNFRVAAAEAHAYTDGLISAWGEAWHNTTAVLQREGSSELFLNADTLGLQKLAKAAAKMQAKARKRQGGVNFERVDLDARPRQFALNPHDRRVLREHIENLPFPRLMQQGLMGLVRTAGAALNATGTGFRTGTILFINAPDQFVGTMAAKAGSQTFAVRQAAKEAAELGLEGKELDAFLKARWTSLTSDIDGWANEGFEKGFREAAAAAGEHEAREILFQDPADFAFTRSLSRMHHETPFAHAFIEFLHTPLRILERTVIDFTPLGLFKDRIRRAIVAGGPERDQAIAMMALGTYTFALAWQHAKDRTVVGTDGGFASSARLQRESFTMRVLGDDIEFVRADPMGSILGLAADLQAYLENNNDSPEERQRKAEIMQEAAVHAISANILSKTWLVSLKDLVELSTAGIAGRPVGPALRRLKKGKVRRLVPAAGLQKGVRQIVDPWEYEATSVYDEMLKNTFLAGKLPVKRDILGRPMEVNLGERFTGLTWQPTDTDPLVVEMQELNFRAPAPETSLYGVRLSADQKARLMELKGQVVRSEKYGGLTMEQALREVIKSDGYKAMRREARVETLREVMSDYTRDAKAMLLAEDKQLAQRVVAEDLFQQGRKDNLSDAQIATETEQVTSELGLSDD